MVKPECKGCRIYKEVLTVIQQPGKKINSSEVLFNLVTCALSPHWCCHSEKRVISYISQINFLIVASVGSWHSFFTVGNGEPKIVVIIVIPVNAIIIPCR